MLRRRRKPPDPLAEVDPSMLRERWAAPVREALACRARFQAAIESALAGPMSSRLDELRATVDAGVLATWSAARRAQAREDATASIDLDRITDQHKAARRELAAAKGAPDPTLVARAEALAERHRSAQRLLNSVDDAARELEALELRLDSAAVRGAELALTGGAGPAGAVAELDEVLGELGALRAALDELG